MTDVNKAIAFAFSRNVLHQLHMIESPVRLEDLAQHFLIYFRVQPRNHDLHGALLKPAMESLTSVTIDAILLSLALLHDYWHAQQLSATQDNGLKRKFR